jgi:hypothetical protein
MFPVGIPQWAYPPHTAHWRTDMMHPDDVKRMAIMATLIMLCAFCPGPGRAASEPGFEAQLQARMADRN